MSGEIFLNYILLNPNKSSSILLSCVVQKQAISEIPHMGRAQSNINLAPQKTIIMEGGVPG